MRTSLGGATHSCSASRVRRMLLGELPAADAAELRAHVDGCARCEAVAREVEAERAQLRLEVPFDELAAGVAEKLAKLGPPSVEALKVVGPRRWAALAAGASALLVAAAALLVIQSRGDGDGGLRSKGGASAQIFAKRGQTTLALTAPAHVLPGDQLLITLEPDGMTDAVALLAEPLPGKKTGDGSVSVLFQGPAPRGALPSGFEWTGAATEADLIIVLGKHPLDAAALGAQAKHGQLHASQGRGETVLVGHLVRGP